MLAELWVRVIEKPLAPLGPLPLKDAAIDANASYKLLILLPGAP
jgi:hypothetical protein